MCLFNVHMMAPVLWHLVFWEVALWELIMRSQCEGLVFCLTKLLLNSGLKNMGLGFICKKWKGTGHLTDQSFLSGQDLYS